MLFMGFKRKYKLLETRVDTSETYDDFTRAVLRLQDDRYVHFELSIAFKLKTGDRVVFHNCRIKMVKQRYIDNKSYSSLEIYAGNSEEASLKLEGREANRLERLAAKQKN